jgi:ATP-dependent DNA helicase PIF1
MYNEHSVTKNRNAMSSSTTSIVSNKRLHPDKTQTNGLFNVYVSKQDYVTDHEHLLSQPAESWFMETNTRFLPHEVEVGLTMAFDENLIWRSVNTGHSVLLSGAAGSGKSELLKKFVSHLEKTSTKFRLTAPTGIAAYNIKGETLHRALGLGLAGDDMVALFRMIKNNPRKFSKTWKFLQETEILIIDEISMVTRDLFMKLNYLFKNARQNTTPFGGVILIMIGDFCQLNPVVKKSDPNYEKASQFVFENEVFSALPIMRIILQRSYRQNEPEFINLLNHVRTGTITQQDLNTLQNRVGVDVSVADTTDCTLVIRPVTLYSYKKNVDEHNEKELISLIETQEEKLYKFAPRLRVEILENGKTYNETLVSNDKKSAQAMIKPDKWKQLSDKFPVFNLRMCVGAQVMLRTNQYMDIGVYNGSMGIVQSISNDVMKIRFLIDGTFMEDPVEIFKFNFTMLVGSKVHIIMTQFPVSLSYACTIHKTQSLSLEMAIIDLTNCFTYGQAYVALSRLRTLKGVSLKGFNAKSILSNQKAVDFETFNDPVCKKLKSHKPK